MYKDYYRFNEEPFNITPDPRFVYLTGQHREAMNHLLYGIGQRKGFICLTGEVGTGKTTLCRTLLGQLGPAFRTALILNPVLTEGQLLRAVAQEFGITARCRDSLGYLNLLNEMLLKVNAEGGTAVLIIDEVQDMPERTLEMTRLLSNLETHSQKLLQIVLVGQPELRQMLARPSLRQLAQRITVRYHLGLLSPQETACYIRHRLAVAGGDAPISFDAGAIMEIHRFSGGTPRLINAISDKVLLAGYVYQTSRFDKKIVEIAAAELQEAC